MPSGHTVASDAARARATKRKLERFLKAFSRIGSARKACTAVRLSTSTVYARRKSDPDFARRWDEIVERQCDELEASLYEMATGIERTIRYQGKVVGTKMEYSDYAALKLLQARRPEIYGGGERLRGCTVAGYRRDGRRGAIVERDGLPTSVQVRADADEAQAAIEMANAFATEAARPSSAPPFDEMHLVETDAPPPCRQMHLAATDAPHDAPDVEVLPASASGSDAQPAPSSEPDARPRPRVVVSVTMRRGGTPAPRVGFGWPVPRRDEE